MRKIGAKQFTTFYFNSWWTPAVATLSALAALTVSSIYLSKYVDVLSKVLLILLGLSFIGILTASIYNFIKRRWAKALINVLSFLVCVIITIYAACFLISISMFGPSADGFGKGIIIPPDMKVESPIEANAPTNNPAEDDEGQALVDSFSKKGSKIDTLEMSVDFPVLNKFAGEKRAILIRHLASSAKWFLTKEQGGLSAYRRCVVNGRWQNSLNGFYTASDFDTWHDQRFQFRIILKPDGPVTNQPFQEIATLADVSNRFVKLKVVDDKKFGQGSESYLVLESMRVALEIFEQSPSHSRPFTPLALQQINRELQSVIASSMARQCGFDPSCMPTESIKTGCSEIHIRKGMQGGIYLVYAYVNPGEKGYTYLRVYEATKNTPLSADRISDRSIEYTGWSSNSNEQFFYNSEITVYEGDWGVYYPARFELWFVPESGKPENKLVENIFLIEGWQR